MKKDARKPAAAPAPESGSAVYMTIVGRFSPELSIPREGCATPVEASSRLGERLHDCDGFCWIITESTLTVHKSKAAYAAAEADIDQAWRERVKQGSSESAPASGRRRRDQLGASPQVVASKRGGAS